jgi:hypothetical protein
LRNPTQNLKKSIKMLLRNLLLAFVTLSVAWMGSSSSSSSSSSYKGLSSMPPKDNNRERLGLLRGAADPIASADDIKMADENNTFADSVNESVVLDWILEQYNQLIRVRVDLIAKATREMRNYALNPIPSNLGELEVGSHALAKWSKEGKWYRCRIVKFNRKDRVYTIRFNDGVVGDCKAADVNSGLDVLKRFSWSSLETAEHWMAEAYSRLAMWMTLQIAELKPGSFVWICDKSITDGVRLCRRRVDYVRLSLDQFPAGSIVVDRKVYRWTSGYDNLPSADFNIIMMPSPMGGNDRERALIAAFFVNGTSPIILEDSYSPVSDPTEKPAPSVSAPNAAAAAADPAASDAAGPAASAAAAAAAAPIAAATSSSVTNTT